MVIIDHAPAPAARGIGVAHRFVLSFEDLSLSNHGIAIGILWTRGHGYIVEFFHSIIKAIYIQIEAPDVPVLVVISFHIGMDEYAIR